MADPGRALPRFYKAAIASTDQENVDLHFGKCDCFTIAEVDGADGSWRLAERRPAFALCEAGDSDETMEAAVNVLSDCAFVVVNRIGRWPYAALYAKGIESIEFRGPIADVMERVLNQIYKERESRSWPKK